MTKPLRSAKRPRSAKRRYTTAADLFPPLRPDHPIFNGQWFVGERRSAPRPTPPKKPEE
jgi:hypothetical protein